MTYNQAPSREDILETLPPERRPYILGHIALTEGDELGMIDALEDLHNTHIKGVLRPPIPNVLAADAERTVKHVRSGGQADETTVKLLLATVLDFGNVRYATDPSHNERRRSERLTRAAHV